GDERVRVSGRRRYAQARAGHGEVAGQQPGGGMGSDEVHGSIPREPAQTHPGKAERQEGGPRGGRRAAAGRSGGSHGAPAAEPRTKRRPPVQGAASSREASGE